MPGVFTTSEIVEIGIRIEENGRDFYKTLLSKTENKKAKEIFKFLAEEEKRHITTFQGILDKLDKYESTDSYPGEYLSYLTTLAGEYVFTKKDVGVKIAKDAKGDKEAIDLGIGFEKDSIVFYEGIKNIVSADRHKVIEELILQEEGHLKRLSELKEEIS
ncbi:MAG: ferritin family protein [Candidatus Omnitrophica bacterium]|nr:ferritin family protein [Candidatus Omnitrophota bacterium]